MFVGSWLKDVPPPRGVSASGGFPDPPKKKSSTEETARQSIPQVLEQELGTSNGSPWLGMCAASLRMQSIGLLWFITDKSRVVRFHLLI